MRLVCPNCGAQYEVPDEVIPDAGRDVQCSACGDTWFQHHPAYAPPPAEAAVEAAPDLLAEDAQDDLPELPEDDAPEEWPDEASPDEDAPEASDPAPEAPDDLAARASALPDEDAYYDEDEEETAAAPPLPVPRPRKLDPAVQSVLREEAEREARRRSTPPALESQPDLGLTAPQEDPDARKEAARRRMARVKGEEADASPPATTATAAMAAATTAMAQRDATATAPAEPTSRRDLLPDIEEINSTLRSKGERRGPAPAADPVVVHDQRRGFRIGFGLTLMVTALAIAVYINADRIAARLPQTAPAMASYKTQVDTGRIWLNVKVAQLLAWLDTTEG